MHDWTEWVSEGPKIKFHENNTTCKRTAEFEAYLLNTKKRIENIEEKTNVIFANQYSREIKELVAKNEIWNILCEKLEKYKEYASKNWIFDKIFHKEVCQIIAEYSKDIAINSIWWNDFQLTMNSIRDYKSYAMIVWIFDGEFYNQFIHDAYIARANYFLALHKAYEQNWNSIESEQNDEACRACISILERDGQISLREMYDILSQLKSFKNHTKTWGE